MVAAGNVGAAFAMVVGAGAASSLGAAVVFCVRVATPRLLAVSLGFAAGVMIYVVFAEILTVNSLGSFKDAGFSEDASYRLATACFFGGMLATAVLDWIVHQMMHLAARCQHRRVMLSMQPGKQTSSNGSRVGLILAPTAAHNPLPAIEEGRQHCSCMAIELGGDCTDDPKDIEMYSTTTGPHARPTEPGCCSSTETCCRDPGDPDCCGPTARTHNTGTGEAALEIQPGTAPAEVVAVLQQDPHTKDLLRMGVITGLAIAIHNIPEGLATFVGALSNSKVGGSIAAAIAIHNIPEGICVAMPIYYATGSKLKGFLWGSLTGLMEPLGGLLGFLVLDQEEPLSFGIVFGMVAGIMVYVSFKELLPSAFRFDANGTVVSTSVIVGMAIMAASLLLFTL